MKNYPSNRTPGGANLGGKVSFGPAFSRRGALPGGAERHERRRDPGRLRERAAEPAGRDDAQNAGRRRARSDAHHASGGTIWNKNRFVVDFR